MNTATARALAYDAATKHDWAEAARLYQLAIDLYPQPHTGELAKHDLNMLSKMAGNYRRAAEHAAIPSSI